MSTRPSAQAAFGEPVNLGPKVNSAENEGGPCFSRDGLTLLFNSERGRGHGGNDLWVSKRPAPDAPFGEPVNLGPAVNSQFSEGNPAISPDGLTLVFMSDRPGGHGSWDLWASIRPRPDAPFGPAVNLGPAINSEATEGVPCFSADGAALLFASDRPGGSGGIDLWMCRRIESAEQWTTLSNGWRVGKPVNLGPSVNRSGNEFTPFVSGDGLTLLLASWRPGGNHQGDLWVHRRRSTGDAWGEPVNLGPAVDSASVDTAPYLSPDGLTLLFQSSRPGGLGEHDLWICTRRKPEDAWGSAANLGSTVNSASVDQTPSLSADGLTLVFSSDRQGGLGGDDLWMSTRRSTNDPWGPPTNLGAPVNGQARETGSCLSADGLTLFFTSNRRGRPQLWMSTRHTTAEPFGEPVRLGEEINSGQSTGAPSLSSDGRTLHFGSDRPGGQGGADVWQVALVPPGATPTPSPPVSDDARWGPWQDLFDGKTLDGWKVADTGRFARHGKVALEDGKVVLEPGEPNSSTGIGWSGAFPTTDYEVLLRAAGPEGRAGHWIYFPFAGTPLLLSVESQGVQLNIGLEVVDGQSHHTYVEAPRAAGQAAWHDVRLRVTSKALTVWADDEKVWELLPADHKLAPAGAYDGLGTFGLLTQDQRVTIHSVRLRRLKVDAAAGQTPTEGPAETPPPARPIREPGKPDEPK